jgi:hypothetical protein
MHGSALSFFTTLGLVLAGCVPPHERPRDPSEVAPVQTRDTTLYNPSTSGGYSQPGLGTTEPER